VGKQATAADALALANDELHAGRLVTPGDGDGAEQGPVRAIAVALDEEDLRDVREQPADPAGGRQGLDGAHVDPAVAAVDGPGLAGH
jgi:hypothetical protein